MKGNALFGFAAPAVLVLLLTSFARAQQDAAALLGAACGPEDVKFDVYRRDSAPHLPQLPNGKARIVIFAESLEVETGCGAFRFGVDGKWIGGACLQTWIATDLEPGDHHLCATSNSPGKLTALNGFTAEAGKTYYLRAEVTLGYMMRTAVRLEPVNEDEGRYLMATEKSSESTGKK